MSHQELDVDDDYCSSPLPPAIGELLPKVIERWKHLIFVREPLESYQHYLQTDHWNEVRADALKRYDNRCAICNSPDRLDVHHRTYERLHCELPMDVVVLCHECHDLFHKNRKIFHP